MKLSVEFRNKLFLLIFDYKIVYLVYRNTGLEVFVGIAGREQKGTFNLFGINLA